MKYILILLFPLTLKAQKDTLITDSTALLSIKHIDRVAKYLEDKLIAKDYNLVMGALNSVLQEAINDRKKHLIKPK